MMKTLRASFRLVIFGLFSVLTVALFCLGLPICRLTGKSRTVWKTVVISRWAAGVACIMGMSMNIEGPLPEPPFLLVSNHLSYLDILPFWKHLKTTFVAKDDIQKWPFFGFAARVLGILFINRQNKRDLSRINRLIKKNRTQEQGVIIFPEGTSSKGEAVLPFKSSLFHLPAQKQWPVYAASISYRVSSASNFQAWEDICWWGDMDFLPHLWKVFKIKSFRVRVTFGKGSFRDANRKKLCQMLQEEVEKNFRPTYK